MTTRERPRTAREALDETDVERAIADETPADEATDSESSFREPAPPAAADVLTTEDLEEQLEDIAAIERYTT